MKQLVSFAALVALAASAFAVTVDYSGDVKAVAFAAKEARQILSGAEGEIRFAVDASLAPQEWRLEAKGGRLVVSGRDGMALVHGLYVFLEKYVGCRWYAPDTVRIPDRRGWKIPDLSDRGRPAIACREMYVGSDWMDSLWRLRNRETMRVAFGCEVSVGSPGHCHTFEAYHKAIKEDLKPDMMGVRPNGKPSGQFCPSHPQVRHLVAEAMKRNIRKDRAECEKRGAPRYAWPTVYELSQDDGGTGGCSCAACSALDRAAGSQSGSNLAFADAVAREVTREFPDVEVRTFAYSYTEMPPTNAVRVTDGLSVRYCRSFLFQPLVRDTDNGRLMAEWDAHVARKHVWSYWRTFSGPVVPSVKPRADIGAEMRFCRDMKVVGYFAEDEQPISRSFAAMQHWLFLKLSENPDLDVFALADEFAAAYYGRASGPIMEYLAYMERREKECWSRIDRKFLLGVNSGNLAQYVQRDYLDADFFRRANALLDEAERLAKGDPAAELHVAHERLVVDRTMRSMAVPLRRAGYEPDLAAAAARTERALPALIEAWDGFKFKDKEKAARLAAARMEIAAMKRPVAPLPRELAGRDVWPWEPGDILGGYPGDKIVDDPEAAAGVAVRFPIPQKNHKLPFIAGAYGNLDRIVSECKLSAEEIPQDGKYHAIRLGEIAVVSPARVYFDWTWRWSTWLPTMGAPGEKREVWASVKFLGPAYVKGAAGESEVRFERIFFVAP